MSRNEDYDEAVEFLRETWSGLLRVYNDTTKIPNDIVIRAKEYLDPLTVALLPNTTGILKEIMAEFPHDLTVGLAQYMTLTRRSPEWIVEHGACMENLVLGDSQIQQAGHGAIARYSIAKDEVVVPVPLLRIMDSEVLNSPQFEHFHAYGDDDKATKQLLLNYCFGHPESTMLLCPLSHAIMINHCSLRTQECGPEGPNAAIRWSGEWDPTTKTWLDFTIEELEERTDRGLSLEVVALRDIKPGEEVFIDYQVEWEAAWLDHVASWKPPSSDYEFADEEYFSTKIANDEGGPIKDYFVSGDLRRYMEHPHVYTACHFWETELWERDFFHQYTDWYELSDDEILQYFGADGSQYVGANTTTVGGTTYWPCTIHQANASAATYTVRVWQGLVHNTAPWVMSHVPLFLTNYPRDSIRYFVSPFEGDQHLPNAFRHFVGIPDDIFPSQWKNKQADETFGYDEL